MKTVSLVAVLLALAATAFALLPLAGASLPYSLYAVIGLEVVALVAILAARAPAGGKGAVPVEPAPPAPAPVLPIPRSDTSTGAEAVGLLAMLQDKGRLVDFLMGDITAYNDAQVGAAARVVHGGCRSVLQDHFRIRPVREEGEGAVVQVPAGYQADEYRLIGRITGEAPFTGRLIHRGWRTDEVRLPQILRGADNRLPTIAPAEVELK